MPLNILGNIFHLVTNFIIRNFKIFCELILGGGLFLYLIDAYRQRKQQKILIRKLTKEVTFELFSQEVVLSTIISDFESLIKNPIEITGVHRLSLIVTEAILSSGYFVNFRHEFNDLLFNIYKRLKNIDFELDKFRACPKVT